MYKLMKKTLGSALGLVFVAGLLLYNWWGMAEQWLVTHVGSAGGKWALRLVLLIALALIFLPVFAAQAAGLGEIVAGVGGALGGVASGGLLGLAGSALGGVFKWLNAKQEMEREAKLFEQELKLQAMQMEARAAETEQEIALANSEGSWNSLEASIQADAATSANLSPWAANIKSLFRPFLTLLLVVLTGWIIWLLLGTDLPQIIGEATAQELIVYSVQSLVFSASTAVVWWFGDRSFAPPKAK